MEKQPIFDEIGKFQSRALANLVDSPNSRLPQLEQFLQVKDFWRLRARRHTTKLLNGIYNKSSNRRVFQDPKDIRFEDCRLYIITPVQKYKRWILVITASRTYGQ
jgi:hypothetical protein